MLGLYWVYVERNLFGSILVKIFQVLNTIVFKRSDTYLTDILSKFLKTRPILRVSFEFITEMFPKPAKIGVSVNLTTYCSWIILNLFYQLFEPNSKLRLSRKKPSTRSWSNHPLLHHISQTHITTESTSEHHNCCRLIHQLDLEFCNLVWRHHATWRNISFISR